MNNPAEDFREILVNEYEQRKERNPSYSLRAFGRQIGISHSYLSLFLRKKTPLTPRAVKKVAKHLAFDSEALLKAIEQKREEASDVDPNQDSSVVQYSREVQIRQMRQKLTVLLDQLKSVNKRIASGDVDDICHKFEYVIKS